MRKSAILLACLFSIGMLQAQENTDVVKKGTVLTLGTTTASGYQHIDFPRKNVIMKRGAIANFNNLEGRKVVVEDVRTENGTTEVVLKRKDGLNFFRFWPSAQASLDKAIASGELKLPKSLKKESLATP